MHQLLAASSSSSSSPPPWLRFRDLSIRSSFLFLTTIRTISHGIEWFQSYQKREDDERGGEENVETEASFGGDGHFWIGTKDDDASRRRSVGFDENPILRGVRTGTGSFSPPKTFDRFPARAIPESSQWPDAFGPLVEKSVFKSGKRYT